MSDSEFHFEFQKLSLGFVWNPSSNSFNDPTVVASKEFTIPFLDFIEVDPWINGTDVWNDSKNATDLIPYYNHSGMSPVWTFDHSKGGAHRLGMRSDRYRAGDAQLMLIVNESYPSIFLEHTTSNGHTTTTSNGFFERAYRYRVRIRNVHRSEIASAGAGPWSNWTTLDDGRGFALSAPKYGDATQSFERNIVDNVYPPI